MRGEGKEYRRGRPWKEGKKRENVEESGENKEEATAVSGGEATGWLLVPALESQGLSAQALPWRKRTFPGGGLGIVVNIIDTAVGQLSLFPSEK